MVVGVWFCEEDAGSNLDATADFSKRVPRFSVVKHRFINSISRGTLLKTCFYVSTNSSTFPVICFFSVQVIRLLNSDLC